MKNLFFFLRFGKFIRRNYKYYFTKRGKLERRMLRDSKDAKLKYSPIKGKEDFISKQNFTLTEKDNSLLINLKKRIEQYDITVTFHSKPVYDIIIDKDENNDNKGCRFYILLKSIVSTNGLLIIANTNVSKIIIERVIFNDNIEQFFESYLKTSLSNEYLGPEFSSLDENLIEEFGNFVEKTLDINKEFCSFIELMAYDKDQRLYMYWINSIINILK